MYEDEFLSRSTSLEVDAARKWSCLRRHFVALSPLYSMQTPCSDSQFAIKSNWKVAECQRFTNGVNKADIGWVRGSFQTGARAGVFFQANVCVLPAKVSKSEILWKMTFLTSIGKRRSLRSGLKKWHEESWASGEKSRSEKAAWPQIYEKHGSSNFIIYRWFTKFWNLIAVSDPFSWTFLQVLILRSFSYRPV